MHDRRQACGVIPDRPVDEEQAPRATFRDEAAHVIEPGDEPRALRADPLLRQTLRASRVGVIPGEWLDLARSRRQLLHGSIAALLEERDAELFEHWLHAPGMEDGRRIAVVPVSVPRPARQMHRAPRLPVDAHAVDLRPATAGLDDRDRVPGVPVGGGRRARRDLVDRRVEVLGRTIAVGTGEDAAAHAPARHVLHADVLPSQDGLVVALPFFEERFAPLLLDLVVRDLRRGDGLHRAAAPAVAWTRGRTSFARTSICWR